MLLSRLVEAYEQHNRAIGKLAATTQRNYLLRVRAFARDMGPDAKLTDYTVPAVRTHALSVCTKSPKSVRLVKASLTHFSRYLIRERWITTAADPSREIELPSVTQEVRQPLEQDSVWALLDGLERLAVPARKKAISSAVVHLLVFCGCRRAEIASLTLDRIHWGKRTIVVLGKGNKEREIPIASVECWAALEAYQRVRPVQFDPMFSEEDRRAFFWHGEKKRFSARCVAAIIKQVRIAAGLGGLRFTSHHLRHTYATLSEENGAPLTAIQAALGHASVTTTALYLHSSARGLKKASDAGLMGPQRPKAPATELAPIEQPKEEVKKPEQKNAARPVSAVRLRVIHRGDR